MPKRKTHEQFMKELVEVHGDEYEILEQYKNGTTKIEVRHNACGHTYKIEPY